MIPTASALSVTAGARNHQNRLASALRWTSRDSRRWLPRSYRIGTRWELTLNRTGFPRAGIGRRSSALAARPNIVFQPRQRMLCRTPDPSARGMLLARRGFDPTPLPPVRDEPSRLIRSEYGAPKVLPQSNARSRSPTTPKCAVKPRPTSRSLAFERVLITGGPREFSSGHRLVVLLIARGVDEVTVCALLVCLSRSRMC